jgi:hypothetical protein
MARRLFTLREAFMRRALSFFGMVSVLVTTGTSDAQLRDWLTKNDSRNGSTVVDFLTSVERVEKVPVYRDELRRLKVNVGLVFVPGILGSALKSGTGEEIWGYSQAETEMKECP